VERVQDISDNDCYEEGIARPNSPHVGSAKVAWDNARNGYRELWESINSKDSWAVNPWVWVVEFNVLRRAERVVKGVG